ncbi:MAG: ATP-binding protein, partial [bacterium]|nr:ATP-binding protein [bacterium]
MRAASLSEELGLLVVLRPCLKRSLGRSDVSLSNYEIKRDHRVIRGNKNVLSKMPDIAPDQIPLSEGTRLLMNRGKRLLDMKLRMNSGKPLTREEHHLFIKEHQNVIFLGGCGLGKSHLAAALGHEACL